MSMPSIKSCKTVFNVPDNVEMRQHQKLARGQSIPNGSNGKPKHEYTGGKVNPRVNKASRPW